MTAMPAAASAPAPSLREVHKLPASTVPPARTVAAAFDERMKRAVAKKHIGRRRFFARRVKSSERMMLMDNLSTMLTAGLGIIDSLIILSEEIKNKELKRIILEIKAGVESGQAFSDSLDHYPQVFPKIFVSTIRVGEVSGTLAEVLARLADMARKENRLKRKVIGALMYPTVVMFAMIVVSIIMLTYVFPQIISVFNESNIKLPVQILFLNWLGQVLQLYGFWILLAIVLVAVAVYWVMKIRRIKKYSDRLLLRVPVIGKKIVKGAIIARLTSNLRTMLISGLSIIKGLEIIAETLKNLEYKDELLLVAKEIETGRSIHDAMATRPHLFPSIVTRMIKVGEGTGKLDDILQKLAVYYEEKVDDLLTNLSTIIEPALLLLVGLAVGFLAVSIIGPIYDIASQI